MSYVNMDHAAWVESRNASVRKHGKPKKDKHGRLRGYHTAPEKLNRFQARAMDICGMVFGGIYNAPISWDLVEWSPSAVHLPLRHGDMATWDYGNLSSLVFNLSSLVFLCHEARIRGNLSVHGRGWMLSFHVRSHEGRMAERHPDLAEAVADMAAYLPADHRVRYVAELDDPLPANRRHHLEYLASDGLARAVERVTACLAKEDAKGAAREHHYVERIGTDARELVAKLGGGADLEELLRRMAGTIELARASVACGIWNVIASGQPMDTAEQAAAVRNNLVSVAELAGGLSTGLAQPLRSMVMDRFFAARGLGRGMGSAAA